MTVVLLVIVESVLWPAELVTLRGLEDDVAKSEACLSAESLSTLDSPSSSPRFLITGRDGEPK
jgi:hypothetical protein